MTGKLVERTPAHWLQRAEKARALADDMDDVAAREAMLEIAAKYDAMAQQAEGREVRLRTREKR